MYQQINEYFESILSKFQCFKFQTRIQCATLPLVMVKKIKIIRDNRIPHGLLIAKLDASGFDEKSLSFIYFCLSL